MALIPICPGLCSSPEGLCESCQYCKTTALLEGEGEDVRASSRGLCAIPGPKPLRMLLLSSSLPSAPNPEGSRATGGCKNRLYFLFQAMRPCQPHRCPYQGGGSAPRLPLLPPL